MKDYSKKLITEFGYSEYEAAITNVDLNNMDSESIAVLEKLFNGENEEVYNYSVRDLNVRILIEKYNLSVIAAILSIDSLKKDFEGYMRVLNSYK